MLARVRAAMSRRDESSPARSLGARGELAAARLLRRAGYRVLGRNVHVRQGEADLVCLAPDGRTVVVVEVKSRRRAAPGAPGSAVDPEAGVHAAKRRKLVQVTRALSRANGWQGRPIRIDVVTVDWPHDPDAPPSLRHYIDAVTANDA